ncbi:MAG TPA: hypothetical protein EYQ50_29545 [Verrucomicrobiales bacterium]|nr:hypothetical protein [Verrucomicrobiales bacterium]
MKNLINVFILGSLFLFVTACSKKLPPWAENDVCTCGATAEWIRLSPPEGIATILMPSQPSGRTNTQDTKTGKVIIHEFTVNSSSNAVFVLTFAEFPDILDLSDSEAVLDRGLKGVVGVDGKLVSDSEISLDGYAGRETDIKKIGERFLVGMRMYLVGQQIVQAVCTMEMDSLCQKHMHKFLDSIKIKLD